MSNIASIIAELRSLQVEAKKIRIEVYTNLDTGEVTVSDDGGDWDDESYHRRSHATKQDSDDAMREAMDDAEQRQDSYGGKSKAEIVLV